jgi:hypothetical protein
VWFFVNLIFAPVVQLHRDSGTPRFDFFLSLMFFIQPTVFASVRRNLCRNSREPDHVCGGGRAGCRQHGALKHFHQGAQNSFQNGAELFFGLGSQNVATPVAPKYCRRRAKPKKLAGDSKKISWRFQQTPGTRKYPMETHIQWKPGNSNLDH